MRNDGTKGLAELHAKCMLNPLNSSFSSPPQALILVNYFATGAAIMQSLRQPAGSLQDELTHSLTEDVLNGSVVCSAN